MKRKFVGSVVIVLVVFGYNPVNASTIWDPKCDVNKDYKMDVLDISEVASRYNSSEEVEGFSSICDINNNKIKDIETLKYLTNLKLLQANNNEIRYLSLTGNNISPEQQKELQEALNYTIIF